MNRLLPFVALLLALPRAEAAPRCATPSTPEALTTCAVVQSPEVAEARALLAAALAEGGRAARWLPSNPSLSLMGARRWGPEATAWNGYLTLNQELEIAGQRGQRQQEAEAGVESARARLLQSEEQAALRVWRSWIDAVEAEALLREATRREGDAQALASALTARVEAGRAIPLEGELARLGHARSLRRVSASRAAAAMKRAELARLLPESALPEPLPPLIPSVEAGANPPASASLLEARAASSSLAAHAGLLERQRLPNPTLSLSAQLDGFQERVFGLGLSLPLPVPEPLGSLNGPERAALAEQRVAATARVAAEQRRQALELEQAEVAWTHQQELLASLPPSETEAARRALLQLRVEVEGGRLGAREAFALGEGFDAVLLERISLEAAFARACLELARARSTLRSPSTP